MLLFFIVECEVECILIVHTTHTPIQAVVCAFASHSLFINSQRVCVGVYVYISVSRHAVSSLRIGDDDFLF